MDVEWDRAGYWMFVCRNETGREGFQRMKSIETGFRLECLTEVDRFGVTRVYKGGTGVRNAKKVYTKWKWWCSMPGKTQVGGRLPCVEVAWIPGFASVKHGSLDPSSVVGGGIVLLLKAGK